MDFRLFYNSVIEYYTAEYWMIFIKTIFRLHLFWILFTCHKELDWVVRLRSVVHLWDLGLRVECPPCGSFQGILARIYASSAGPNSERLGRLGIEPDTSRLPALSAEPLGLCWGLSQRENNVVSDISWLWVF